VVSRDTDSAAVDKTHGLESYPAAGFHRSRDHRREGDDPGKKMPGQLGNATVKIRKLTVVKVDPELHALIVRGSVPGKAGNLLRISPAKVVGKTFLRIDESVSCTCR